MPEKTWRVTSRHAEDLDALGRTAEPGEQFTADLTTPHDKALVSEGRLLEIPDAETSSAPKSRPKEATK